MGQNQKNKKPLRRTTPANTTFQALSIAVVMALGSSACDGTAQDTNQSISFASFRAGLARVSGSGAYLLEGDITVAGDKRLRDYYDRRFGGDALSAVHDDGADRKWNSEQKRNLTYCISDSFGVHKQAVIDATQVATEDWEESADVDFIYLPSQDGNCTERAGEALMDIKPSNTSHILASAFFPDDPSPFRTILLNITNLENAAAQSDFPASSAMRLWLEGIMRHELGHVLGFRHEHVRGFSDCREADDNYRDLTEYDSDSVMHYPECGGTNGYHLTLTQSDREGAAAFYGEPGTAEPNRSNWALRTQTDSGQVQEKEAIFFGPFRAAAGSVFKASLRGDNDGDLYVRVGVKPEPRKYDCRPYLVSSNENCAVDVGDEDQNVWIAVASYDGLVSFDLNIESQYPLQLSIRLNNSGRISSVTRKTEGKWYDGRRFEYYADGTVRRPYILRSFSRAESWTDYVYDACPFEPQLDDESRTELYDRFLENLATCTPIADREPSRKWVYGENGRLTRKMRINAEGRVFHDHHHREDGTWSHGARWTYHENGSLARVLHFEADSTGWDGKRFTGQSIYGVTDCTHATWAPSQSIEESVQVFYEELEECMGPEFVPAPSTSL